MIDLEQSSSEFEIDQVFSKIWSQDDDRYIAFRQNKEYVLRLTHMETLPVPLQLPHGDRFKFINPKSGAFTDIEVGPTCKLEASSNNVEIEVQATALNFRDLFLVLKPAGFTLPDDNSQYADSVGLDISGTVVAVGPSVTKFKVGDEVCGYTEFNGLASHVVTPETILTRIPPNMTFTEACTIPCAYMTAHISLIGIAKITSADRVLIHVATGGVGLAAVQVAKSVGAEIYATAGSKRKRAYLRSLGIKYVYHSRDTSYGDGIEKDTNGLGVTAVLNSLTGPNFKETTLRCCSPNAYFMEIAKINIWKPEEIAVLRPDVLYAIIDLTNKESMTQGNIELKRANLSDLFEKTEKCVASGLYKGLPNVSFPLSQIREAFYYFQKAKHIGKVVIRIPKSILSPSGKIEHKHELFNSKRYYLINGGLGGIGIEVTR